MATEERQPVDRFASPTQQHTAVDRFAVNTTTQTPSPVAPTTPAPTPISPETQSAVDSVTNIPAPKLTGKEIVDQTVAGMKNNVIHNIWNSFLDKLNINPGRLLSANVAEAPSIEQNTGTQGQKDQSLNDQKTALDNFKVDQTDQKSVDAYNSLVDTYNTVLKTPAKPSLTDTYEASHPLNRLDNIFASGIINGATGGQIHPQSIAPKNIGEYAMSAFSQGLGAISTFSAIENKLGGIQTPEALKGFISQFPKVAKYALPAIEATLKSAPSFIALGQLNPNLNGLLDRLKAAGTSLAMSGVQGSLSFLPKGASVPLNGALWSGLAKLNGASNQDAAAQGVMGMFFDALSPHIKISTELSAGKVNSILGEQAAETLNKYSETKINPNSSETDIKKAYSEAIRKTHPDLGGSEKDAASINAARDLLLKTSTSEIPKTETTVPNESSVTPQDITDIAEQFKQPVASETTPPVEPIVTPLTEGQSSTVGTTRSQNRAIKKSADYTARQSTFEPLSEADNAKLLAKINKTKPISTEYIPEKIKTSRQVYGTKAGDRFIEGTYNGKRYTSNSFIMEFNSDVQQPSDKVTNLGIENSPKSEAIKQIIPKGGMPVQPERVKVSDLGTKKEERFIELKGDGVIAHVQGKYYDYFNKKYPKAEFLAVADNKAIKVMQGKKLVGLIMPHYGGPKISTTTWEKNPIKTEPVKQKGQKIYANGSSSPRTAKKPVDNSLVEEAKKYNTAEEFVKAKVKFYHGTTAKFDNFDIKTAGKNTEWENAKFGIFFLDDAKRALDFAEENSGVKENPARVIGASVDIKNPLDLTLEGIFNNEKQAPVVVKLLGGEKMSPKDALEFLDENIGLGELGDLHDALYGNIKNKILIQRAGYDGIISQFGKDDNGDIIKEYVAFNTDQVKTEPQLKDIWNQAHQEQTTVPEAPTNEFAKIIEETKTSSDIAKSDSPFGFEYNPQSGFVNTEPVEKAVNNVSEFIRATKKGVKASKDLDDSLYTIQKNAEADRILAVQLLDKIDLTNSDAEAIYHYREDNSLPLTEKQQKIYDESKGLRKEINRIANKLKSTIPITDEDRNSRFVQSRGNVIDRLKAGARGIGKGSPLGKSAPSLKQRVMKALVDENGKRTVVAIKGGEVLAVSKNGTTDLGKVKPKTSTKIKEFYDPAVRRQLEKVAETLGVTIERHPTGRTPGLGGNRAGVSFQGQNLIKLRLSPDQVLAHEIGHQIDEKYNLQDFFKEERYDKERRLQVQNEMRILADKRFEGKEVTPSFKKYVRNNAEKVAVIFESYVSNKEMFQEVAPHLYSDFTDFLFLHPELRPLADIKGSVTLESRILGGEHIAGKKGNTFIDKNGKTYTIDEATTKEIESNTNLTYHKNFLVNDLLTYLNLRQVERATDFLEAYKESPEFNEVGMKIGEGNAPKNWKKTKNLSFSNYVLDPHVADVMNKYAGSIAMGEDSLKLLTGFNRVLRNTIFFNPFMHIPNIVMHGLVNRGTLDWVNPVAYKRLITTGTRAINAVTKQNQDYLDMLNSGAPLMYSNEQTKNLHNLLLAKMTAEVDKNPALEFLKKGLKSINPYVLSGKATWMVQDVVMMQAIYEHQATHPDHSLERSIKEVSAHIPDYRIPANVIFQTLNNPNITMFGAYHYGALKSYYEMAKTLVTGMSGGEKNTGKEAMKARGEVLSKLLMLGITMLVIYPLLDKIVQKVSGNKDAQFRRAGATTFPYHLAKTIAGEEDIGSFIQIFATPAVATKELISQVVNHDMFTFQAIRTKGEPAGTQLKESFSHFLQSIAPVAQYSKVSGGQQSTGQFLMSLVGISSPDAVRSKLYSAVQSAEKKVSSLDKNVVNKVRPDYEKAKTAGFDSPEAQAIVDKMSDADYEVYKTLKAVDTAKDSVTAMDKMRGIVESAHSVGFNSPEAQKIVDKLSDTEYAQYKTVKGILYPTGGTGADGKGTPADQYIKQRGTIQLISDYAKAFGIDPGNAWKALVTKEQLGVVKGNLVGLQRFYGIPFDAKGGSEEYVKALMKNMGIPYNKRKDYSLEHIVPVMSGGDNSPGNLELIDLATHNSYTPFDDALAKAIQGGTMTHKEGAILSKELKIDKSITVDKAITMIK